MSESEKRLREALLAEVREYQHGGGQRVEDALDALLAEHRAEVEAHKKIITVTRDAALEEAKGVAVSEGVSDNRTSQQRAASARANIIAERIDALKSQPARQYVGAEKVREVLARRRDAAQRAMNGATSKNDGAAYHEAGGRMTECENISSDLGMDLDPWDVLNGAADDIRTLKSQPARQYVDAEKVREVLTVHEQHPTSNARLLADLRSLLGVDLDAEGEKATPNTPKVIAVARNAVGLPPLDTRQTCMCVNTCVGPEELRAGWTCALGRGRS